MPIPSTADIESFMLSYPDKIKARTPSGLPSLSYVRNSLGVLLKLAPIYYPKFTFSPADRGICSNAVQGLIERGEVEENTRLYEWVTLDIIKALVRSVFREAIANGTTNWDITIQDCLLLALQSGTTSRGGDLVRSNLYDGNQYVRCPGGNTLLCQ